MQATMINREAFHVLGVQARIHAQEADYGALWSGQFDPRQTEIQALAIEEGYYGIYFDVGAPPMCDFLAGMAVDSAKPAPRDLVLREIPGGMYAKFACTMSEIGVTWQRIMSEWLPAAGYAYDGSRPSIEWYAPGDDKSNGQTAIYMPVVAK